MATQSRNTLRGWFQRGLKPLASQFSDWMDSYWHKTEDEIPMDNIAGLADAINGLATTEALEGLAALLANAVIDCGTFDASAGAFPAAPRGTGAAGAINRANQFDVAVAGTIVDTDGVSIDLVVGTTIRALKNNPVKWADWNIHE